MSKKVVCLLVSCLMIALLVLNSCKSSAGPTSTKPTAPLTPTPVEHKPVDVVFQTSQFGRSWYDYAFAYEDLCRKTGSWVNLKTQETPGANYIVQYYAEHINAQRAGTEPPVIAYGSANSITYIVRGWPPMDKFPNPGWRFYASILCRADFIGTFNPNIKTAKDLAGKRVAVETKAAPFNSTLKYLPYFEKGLGVNVDWQYIGTANGKDALLNGTVDATALSFMVDYTLAPDGTILISKAEPDTATMELLASGRRLYFVPLEPDVLKSVYKGDGMMNFRPAVLEPGTSKGIYSVGKGLGEWLYMVCDESLPDDVVIELTKIRYEYGDKFGNYHAQFTLQPKNPFPSGAPKELIHPAAYKAAEQLGYEVVE